MEMSLAGDGIVVRSLATTYREGFAIAPHEHDWAQLIFARRGMMEVASGSHLWFVPPTRAIWVPPDTVHRITMRGEVGLRTLYLEAGLARRIGRGLGVVEVTALLSELILHIVSIGMLHPANPPQRRLVGVLADLVAAAADLDLMLPLPRDPRAARLAEQLRLHPADKTHLDELAMRAGASLRTLQRRFAAETGMSIETWRQKARMVRASAELAAGSSVTEAGLACGYDSLSAFIAAFRRQFGRTPGRSTD
jgi:AraC-like DNA-binding protein